MYTYKYYTQNVAAVITLCEVWVCVIWSLTCSVQLLHMTVSESCPAHMHV